MYIGASIRIFGSENFVKIEYQLQCGYYILILICPLKYPVLCTSRIYDFICNISLFFIKLKIELYYMRG